MKDSKKGYMGGFGGRKWKRRKESNYTIVSKVKQIVKKGKINICLGASL